MAMLIPNTARDKSKNLGPSLPALKTARHCTPVHPYVQTAIAGLVVSARLAVKHLVWPHISLQQWKNKLLALLRWPLILHVDQTVQQSLCLALVHDDAAILIVLDFTILCKNDALDWLAYRFKKQKGSLNEHARGERSIMSTARRIMPCFPRTQMHCQLCI